jgi:hypothetical protein
MISSSSSTVLSLFFIGLKLTGEFTSQEEPTEVSDFAAEAICSADGPKFIGSERRTEPRDPMQKLRLPIVRSIS